MLRLVLHPAGLLLLRGEEVVWKKAFPDDPSESAKTIIEILRGNFPDELVHFLKNSEIRDGIMLCFHPDRPVTEISGLPVRVAPRGRECAELRRRYRELAAELGVKNYADRVSSTAIALASLRVREELGRRDLLVIRAVDYLDHLNKSLNLLIPAIREWYSIYFPEMNSIVDDHGLYAKLVVEIESRGGLCRGDGPEDLPARVADELRRAACRSVGADLKGDDLEIIREVTKRWLELYRTREAVESYLRRVLPKVAPNLTAVLGPLVAARLISTAGGLDRLATLPASTVQILGAQRAVFLHLTRGTKPPKHGILFQAKEVRTAPKSLRGKIARLLASKAAIAARIDVFGGGRYEGDRLRREIDEKLAKIRGER